MPPDRRVRLAAAEVAGTEVAIGSVGAGAGARVGVLKGGVGTASVTLESGVTVGAIVVVNAAGDVVDPRPGCRGWLTDRGIGLIAPPAEQLAGEGRAARRK